MPQAKAASPWRNTFFLLFVLATFVSNVGTWLFNVGAGWLMTDLGSSALAVSLVQTASLLPMLLLALPAGALGDLFDRRRIILISQAFLIINTLVFAYLVYLDVASVSLLLLFTLMNGVGAAFARPVMSAIIPQLVKRSALRTAMASSSIAFNLSRAVGPVLGGLLITRFSIDLPFWIDAVSFGAVFGVIFFWQREQNQKLDLPQSNLKLAMGDSIRFLIHTPALYNSILRATVFFFSASALWALLPLVAKEQLSGDADLYGYLLGIAGLGAVLAGIGGNRITDAFGSNRLVVIASIFLGLGLAGLGFAKGAVIALIAAFVAGVCWQLCFTSLITSAQYALPKWYGARGMSYFIMAMSGAMAGGSALWGWLADVTSIQIAHYAAAGLGILCAPLALRFKLDQAKDADLRAVADYPSYEPSGDFKEDGGWVKVHVHYEIGQADREEIIKKIKNLKPKRYRAGALYWGLYCPADDRERLTETFMEISWGQLKRHERQITREDERSIREVEDWLKEQGGSLSREFFHEVR